MSESQSQFWVTVWEVCRVLFAVVIFGMLGLLLWFFL